MLNEVLCKGISHPDLKAIYRRRIPLSHPAIKPLITTEIRRIRTEIKQKAGANTANLLEDKLTRFKNDGGWARGKVVELNKLIFNPKAISSDSKGLWRSIEFEVIFKDEKALTEFAAGVRGMKLTQFVHVKTDGSLRRNDGDSVGVCREVTLAYCSGNERAVYDLCSVLKGKVYVNKSCGTHVHFDMRHLGIPEVNLYAKRLARCVPALRTLLPKSRRSSEYCANTINTLDTDGKVAGPRYSFINLHAYTKHKTIEIRGHSGTINPDKILNWIKLCEKVMSTDLQFVPTPGVDKDANTIDELIQQYSIDGDLRDYMTSRFKHFNDSGEHTGEGEDTIAATVGPTI